MARSRVPAKMLERLLNDAAANTPECARCQIGPVVEIKPDQTGCNWIVTRIEGACAGDCLAAMADFIDGMREEFLLQTDEMDPTLLTSWATR